MNIKNYLVIKTLEVSDGSGGAVAALKEPYSSQDAMDLDQTTVKPQGEKRPLEEASTP